MTAKRAFTGRRSLRDQIERAAASVSNNIAEGFERGTTQELITTDKTRRATQSAREREEFMEQLRRIREGEEES